MFLRMSGHDASMCKFLYTDIITSVKTSSSSTDEDQWSLNAETHVYIHYACAFRYIHLYEHVIELLDRELASRRQHPILIHQLNPKHRANVLQQLLGAIQGAVWEVILNVQLGNLVGEVVFCALVAFAPPRLLMLDPGEEVADLLRV